MISNATIGAGFAPQPNVNGLTLFSGEETILVLTDSSTPYLIVNTQSRGYSDTVSTNTDFYNFVLKRLGVEDSSDEFYPTRACDYFNTHYADDNYKTIKQIQHYKPNIIITSAIIAKPVYGETEKEASDKCFKTNEIGWEWKCLRVEGSTDIGIAENNKFVIVTDKHVTEFDDAQLFIKTVQMIASGSNLYYSSEIDEICN